MSEVSIISDISNLISVEQLNDHDSTLFKKCLKWGPVWTCEGIGEETYRMLQGAEFIKNTAEGPHITSKHRHITIDGYSLTPDSRCVEAQSHLCFEYLTTSCLFNCAYSLENYRTLRLVIWHYSLPLIIVRFVVPDFWSHVIRRPHVCMSIGLWAAMQTQTNLLKYHYIENTVTHLLRIRFVSVLLCLFRIHAEPKSPSLIVASSVRKIFCFRTQKREEMSQHIT